MRGTVPEPGYRSITSGVDTPATLSEGGRVPAYVAFLRAINLGRTRKVPMASLRGWLAEAGFEGVQTHIQTGNLLLGTRLRSRAKVEATVEGMLAERVGFKVPTIAYRPAELAQVYAAATRLEVNATRRYVTFLKQDPDPGLTETLDAWAAPGEGARVVGRSVYWWIDHPSQDAVMSNARVERQLGVATTRDLKVVRTLVEKWT